MRYLLLALCFIYSPLQAIQWNWNIPISLSGNFHAKESNTNTEISGTYQRLSNSYIQTVVTDSVGVLAPGNGTTFYSLEVPAFAIFSEPILNNNERVSFNVNRGKCLYEPFNALLLFSKWSDGATHDLTSDNQVVFGQISWDPWEGIATVNSLYNITNYAPIAGFSSLNLMGRCHQGVIEIAGKGDRGGKIQLSKSGAMKYTTKSKKEAILIMQDSIPTAASLDGDYSVFGFDASVNSDISPVRINFNNGVAQGNIIDDITNNTLGEESWGLSNLVINTPQPGMFTADLTVANFPATHAACAVFLSTRNMIFCNAQKPGDKVNALNLMMVSDKPAFDSGTLDNYSFGNSGIIYIPSETARADSKMHDLTIQWDGKITAAGNYRRKKGNRTYYTGLARFTSQGNFDTGFGTDGRVLVRVGTADKKSVEQAQAIAFGEDRRLYVGGFAKMKETGNDFTLLKIDMVGGLSKEFGNKGIVTTSFGNSERIGDRVNDLSIQFDGKIVVVGTTEQTETGLDMVIARYTTNGALDTSFNKTGYHIIHSATDSQNRNDEANSVLILPDGTILMAGYSQMNGANKSIHIVKFLSSGILDTSFGEKGHVFTDIATGSPAHNEGMSLALAPNGNFYLGATTRLETTNSDFALLRYLPNGKLDTSFGSSKGYTTTNIAEDSTDKNDFLRTIAVHKNGNVVAGGSYMTPSNGTDFVVATYNSKGTLQTSFATNGLFKLGLADHSKDKTDYLQGLGIQNDNKIVAGGYSMKNSGSKGVLMRLWP